MYEIGSVESVNEKKGTAKVVFDRRAACDKCKMCLAASGDKMKVYVEVKNTLGARPGDKVGVQMNDRFVLRAAFIVYIIPIILVGAGLAIFRKFSDLILLGVVAIALVLGALIGIGADRLIKKNGSFAPKMISIENADGGKENERSNASVDRERTAVGESAFPEENASDPSEKTE